MNRRERRDVKSTSRSAANLRSAEEERVITKWRSPGHVDTDSQSDLTSQSNHDSPETQIPPEEMIDQLVESLASTVPSKRGGLPLTRLSNFLGEHECYRFIVEANLVWRLEAAVSTLAQIGLRARGSRTGKWVDEGILALKTVMVLLQTSSRELLETVSEAAWGTMTNGLLLVISEHEQKGTHISSLGATSPELLCLVLHILGELCRLQLVPNVVEDTTSWSKWWFDLWHAFLKKKESKLSAHIPCEDRKLKPPQPWLRTTQISWSKKGGQQPDSISPSIWSEDDVLYFEGLCLGTCSFLLSMPLAYIKMRHRPSSENSSFIWEIIPRLLLILSECTVPFFNIYSATLPENVLSSSTSSLMLGFPHLLGLVYEVVAAESRASRSDWKTDDQDAEAKAVDAVVNDYAWYETYLTDTLLSMYSKQMNWSSLDQKINTGVSKYFVGLFRQLRLLLESNAHDVEEVQLTPSSCPDKGRKMIIILWRDLYGLRCYRNYCGNPTGSIGFATNWLGEWQFEDGGGCGTGLVLESANDGNETRKMYQDRSKSRYLDRKIRRDRKMQI